LTRGFALHYHPGSSLAVIHNNIRSLLKPVVLEATLYFKQCPRIIKVMNQVVNKMLPDPFLWRQNKIFFSDYIQDKDLTLLLPENIIKGRKV
jgi:hypothetical protein